MKKKKWLILVGIIVAILVLIVIGIGVLIMNGLGCSVGRYLPTENGTSMFICDNSPIVMSNRTNRALFKKLDVGDKILVIHDGIKETYPGGTGVYAVIKIKDGSNEDIPQKVVDELTELGWYPAKVSKEDLHIYTGIGEPIYMGKVAYANWTEAPEVYYDGTNFCAWVRQTNNPENVTDDMAGWMLLMGFDKASLDGCVSFDAVMK